MMGSWPMNDLVRARSGNFLPAWFGTRDSKFEPRRARLRFSSFQFQGYPIERSTANLQNAQSAKPVSLTGRARQVRTINTFMRGTKN